VTTAVNGTADAPAAASAAPAEQSDVKSDTVPSEGPVQRFIVRVGTFYLWVDHDHSGTGPGGELARQLGEALDDDSRVTWVSVPNLDPGWNRYFMAYPSVATTGEDSGLRDGQRHFHVQAFSQPIAFRVHVPLKNQPTTHAGDKVPTEDYFALWNGESLLVAWATSSKSEIGWGGGHIVADVVETAAKKVKADVYVQACNEACDHMVVHTDLLLEMVDDGPRWEVEPDQDHILLLEATARGKSDLESAARAAWRSLRTSLRSFAAVKNSARNVLDLERGIRVDLDQLATVHYQVAELASRPWRPPVKQAWRPKAWATTRFIEHWKARHWRRASRILLSRVWLGLGNLEVARRQWEVDYAHYRRSTRFAQIRPLFEAADLDEREHVANLDLSLMQSSTQQAAARLDNSAVARATIGGAVAGAVAAVAVTLLQ
jgi:plasmid stabilization system protein ParE